MQFRWLFITIVGLYFTGHVLYRFNLLWPALVWLALSVVTGLLFGAVVAMGREPE